MIASLPTNQFTFAFSSNTNLIVYYILSTALTSTGAYVKLIIGFIIGITFTLFTSKRSALVKKINKNLKYKLIKAFNDKRNQLYKFLLQLRLYIKFNKDRFQFETK